MVCLVRTSQKLRVRSTVSGRPLTRCYWSKSLLVHNLHNNAVHPGLFYVPEIALYTLEVMRILMRGEFFGK